MLGQSVGLKIDAKRVLDERLKKDVGTAVEVRPTVSRANNPFDIFELARSVRQAIRETTNRIG